MSLWKVIDAMNCPSVSLMGIIDSDTMCPTHMYAQLIADKFIGAYYNFYYGWTRNNTRFCYIVEEKLYNTFNRVNYGRKLFFR